METCFYIIIVVIFIIKPSAPVIQNSPFHSFCRFFTTTGWIKVMELILWWWKEETSYFLVGREECPPFILPHYNQLSVLSLYIFLLISMKYYWVDDGDDDDNNDDHVCMITFPFMFYYYYKFGTMMMWWSQKTTHFTYKKYRTQSMRSCFFAEYFFTSIISIVLFYGESSPYFLFPSSEIFLDLNLFIFQQRRRRGENNRLVFNNETAASTLYICVFNTHLPS